MPYLRRSEEKNLYSEDRKAVDTSARCSADWSAGRSEGPTRPLKTNLSLIKQVSYWLFEGLDQNRLRENPHSQKEKDGWTTPERQKTGLACGTLGEVKV